MSRRTALHTALALTGAAGLLAATGAVAADPPTFARQQVYFACSGTTKVANVNDVAGDGVPGWDTSAPTASVTTGAGCGTADPAFLINTVESTSQADGSWSGTFTGNIKTITVEAHTIYAGTARAVPGFAVTPRLFIDGGAVPLDTENLEITPVRSSTGASEMVKFSITGIDLTEDLDEDGVADPGPGTTPHTVTLQLNHTYIDGSPVGAWVWDTTEVPSGLVFNPAKAEPDEVRAG